MSAPATPLVMHVIHSLAIGGLENGLVNLINCMPADAYRHAIVCVEDFTDFRLRIQRPGVEVVAMNRSQIGTKRLRRALFTLCRQWRPAIVHSRNMSGLDALVPARLAGVRHIVHGEHGWDTGDLHGQHWKPRLLRQVHSPLVSRYLAVSRDIERYLVQQVGIRAGRVTRVCNGVDCDRFTPQAPAGERSRDWLPDSFRADGLVRIGTVGRTQPVKNQALLLQAFAALLQQSPELRDSARLVLLGDGPLLPDLRALAQSLGIADLCHLPGAFADMPRALRALDLFVLPSLNEGISNTILEAMASQLPVLASAAGGNVELVSDGSAGALFPATDGPALTALLARYLAQPGLRRSHGAEARRLALQDYSLTTMVQSYQRVYDGLLQSDWGAR